MKKTQPVRYIKCFATLTTKDVKASDAKLKRMKASSSSRPGAAVFIEDTQAFLEQRSKWDRELMAGISDKKFWVLSEVCDQTLGPWNHLHSFLQSTLGPGQTYLRLLVFGKGVALLEEYAAIILLYSDAWKAFCASIDGPPYEGCHCRSPTHGHVSISCYEDGGG